jgi:hypothetical protein
MRGATVQSEVIHLIGNCSGGDVAARFMAEVLHRPEVRRLLSDEHFSADRTLIEAFASIKSFRPTDRRR